LVHGDTGRAPARRLEDETRERIVKLRATKYTGFNNHHFTQKLTEHTPRPVRLGAALGWSVSP